MHWSNHLNTVGLFNLVAETVVTQRKLLVPMKAVFGACEKTLTMAVVKWVLVRPLVTTFSTACKPANRRW